MDVEASDVVVSRAVSEVLATFGTEVLGDARRVRACLTDELGIQARARRAEIDAVVLAVEEGVADQLRGSAFDRTDAIRRLQDRGLSSDVAIYAVEVWRHGLGLDGPDSVAPALAGVAGAAALADDVTDPGLIVDLTDRAMALDGSSAPGAQAGTDAVIAGTATGSPRRRRTALMVLSGSVAVAIAVLAAMVVFGGSDQQTTTLKTVSDTATILRFPAEPLAWGPEVTRVWTARNGGLHGELTFTNTTTATATGRHIEAIPKTLAATADLVLSTPKPDEVLQADPVLAYDLTIEAGATRTITYDIADIEVTNTKLQAWQTEQAAALTGYQAGTTTTSTPGTTTSTPTVDTVPLPAGSTVTPTAPTVTTPKTTGPKTTGPRTTSPPATSPPATSPPATSPPATSPPVTAVPLVARNDSYTAQLITCGGVTQGGKCYAQLAMNVTQNDSGPYTAGGYVTAPQSGELLWDSANSQYLYNPQRAGPYTDTFTYQLSNKSGQVSNVATVTITVP